MLKNVLNIEVTRYGTIIEKMEIVCCMTGFRQTFLVEHLGDGLYRSLEVGVS